MGREPSGFLRNEGGKETEQTFEKVLYFILGFWYNEGSKER